MEEVANLLHWRPRLVRIYFVAWIEDKHHHHRHVVLRQLLPGKVIHMDASYYIGQTLTMAIQGVDQYLNPFPLPTPDSPPAWTDTTPATETLTAAADGTSATASGVAPGSDAVTVVGSYGGVSYTGVLDVTVTKAPSVLSGIVIVPTVTGP